MPRQAGLTPDQLKAAPRQLRTARTRLEAATVRHAAAFFDSLQASREHWRFIHWAAKPRDLAWAEDFCARSEASVLAGEDLVFHVFTLDDDRHVGRIDLHSIDLRTPRGEVGYVADLRLTGRGLMHEAVGAVVQLGFELGLARIQACSDERNERALRFAEGLGFVREGVLRCYERDPQGRLAHEVVLARYHPHASSLFDLVSSPCP